jgi:hypothetical protein
VYLNPETSRSYSIALVFSGLEQVGHWRKNPKFGGWKIQNARSTGQTNEFPRIFDQPYGGTFPYPDIRSKISPQHVLARGPWLEGTAMTEKKEAL